MRLHGRTVPPHAIALSVLALFLVVTAVVGQLPGEPPSTADAASVTAVPDDGEEPRRKAPRRVKPKVPAPAPPARSADGWAGYAFDACRAPSQRVMDRWRTASPFTGVGIYLGGIHRACEQRHLTPRWVKRQVRAGWQLLPIWVGPQASCTGYDHRISGRPGRSGRYRTARTAGVRQARLAARAARSLRMPRGEVIFYDIEPYDTRIRTCRQSSLAFLEEWTQEIHRRGYRSGVYSHVNSAISLLSRTPRSYPRPDAVWYAWIDRVGDMPREHVRNTDFMRASRVHQYALDERVEFGGIPMAIDWNYVSLGAVRPAAPPPPSCDRAADRVQARDLRTGERGAVVRVLQCLVSPADRHPLKTSGRFDKATVRAVRSYQARRGLRTTGVVDRRTWTSLLAHGHTPVLRKGARGDSVRRLQRSLNVAVGRQQVRVDGSFGPATARVVRHYRKRVGLPAKPVVTPRVWKALTRGKVLPDRNR